MDQYWRHIPLFIGGVMGPFGTVVILPMFPELRVAFGATSSEVALGFSLYLFPFAALLLVSGTLGERWGRRRTVRATYLLYTAASIGCALAPTLEVFIAGRVVQGIANAFITPLLIAGLAESVPEERFGKMVGVYASFQALGGGLGPVVGGIAADLDWRYAFFGTALVSLLLSMAPPAGEPRRDAVAPPIRPLLSPRIVGLGFAFMAAAAGPIGLGVIVGVYARDNLELSGSLAGIILLGGSLSALLAGPWCGTLLDRWGPARSAVAAAIAVTAMTVPVAFATNAFALAVLWIAVGVTVSAFNVVFQAIGASIIPGNRGGTLSFLLAFRFFGHGIGPIVWLPVFEESARPAFLGAAALGLITVVIAIAIALADRRTSPAVAPP